ncbi:MAG: nuclear transport factor 2 family protein [Candidatus Helarchaeota archaeon]|nr:nuclear transport factor 2 family protein [Candidatus Helarchaeota archaeon]
MSEDEVRKFAEEYMEAREKGIDKWHLKNADTKAMWEQNKESYAQMGMTYDQTYEEFKKECESGVSILKVDENSLTIKSIKVEGDYAEVEIDIKGAIEMTTPLKLSKKSGKWKYIMGPTWSFG